MSDIINGMRELLEKGEDLPALPTVAFQLHEALEDEHARAADVTAILERDPALAARLLRAANSASYAPGATPVGSVSSAVTRLGLNQVRAIFVGPGMVKASQRRAGGLNRHAFSIHSAAVGMTARRLWEHFGRDTATSADDLHLAGLLHDAGLLMLEQHFRTEFEAVQETLQERGGRLWQIEDQRLGMDHGAVGGLLLGRWSLPPYIAEAVTNHHHPHEADDRFREVCRVVQAAEVLCTECGAGLREEGLPDCSAADVLTELGADETAVEALVGEIPRVAERARRLLS